MDRKDFEELEALMMDMVVKRRKLGGFDVNAGDIQLLAEINLKLIQHLKEKTRRVRKEEEE